jgi:hypothetical protein
MKTKRRIPNAAMSLSDVVALFTDLSAQGLARGQFGTVVEQFDDSRGRPMRTPAFWQPQFPKSALPRNLW